MDEKDALPDIDGFEPLPLLPLRDIVVFPRMGVSLFVGREKSINAVEHAIENGNIIMLASQKNARIDDPEPEDIYRVGCVSEIMQVFKMPDGTVKIMVEGIKRARITEFNVGEKLHTVRVEEILTPVPAKRDPEMNALIRGIKDNFGKLLKSDGNIPMSSEMDLMEVTGAEELGDMVVSHISLDTPAKQQLLEEMDLKKRLEEIIAHLETELEVRQIEKRVKGR